MEIFDEPEIVGKIAPLLQIKIPIDDENLESHIIELNSYQYDLAVATSDIQRLLYEKRKQALWPKDKELTELDRKTRLDADTAPIERNYELLSKLEVLVAQRLQICMQLLQ